VFNEDRFVFRWHINATENVDDDISKSKWSNKIHPRRRSVYLKRRRRREFPHQPIDAISNTSAFDTSIKSRSKCHKFAARKYSQPQDMMAFRIQGYFSVICV
jgi:hypothetical protein